MKVSVDDHDFSLFKSSFEPFGVIMMKRLRFPVRFPYFNEDSASSYHPANGDPNSRSPHSPEGRLWISKPYFDPVLHRHVATLPTVQIRYNATLEGFQQDIHKVTCKIVDIKSGCDEMIAADYLVGCDG